MDFRERDIDFREADSRYVELKRQLDAESISEEEFDAQYQELTVEDDEGRLWVKSRETGEWHYRDGRGWTRGTPPGYQPLRTPPAEGTPDRGSQLEQGERLPPSRTVSSDSEATRQQNSRKRHRDVLQGVIIAAGLLVAVGIMLWRFVPGVSDQGGTFSQEDSGPASGYALFEHDSGALSVEVPDEWDERTIVDSEGEKGRSSWSSFLGVGESAGPSMTAVNDLYSWRNGTIGHQGVYMVTSKNLARKYTDDDLVTLGPNDYSSSCEAGTPWELDRPPYSGRVLEWGNCGGDSDHVAITLAIEPQDRECVIVAQIGGYFQTQTDEESIQHVLDTLETDCSNID
jgi:hypothetical protein